MVQFLSKIVQRLVERGDHCTKDLKRRQASRRGEYLAEKTIQGEGSRNSKAEERLSLALSRKEEKHELEGKKS